MIGDDKYYELMKMAEIKLLESLTTSQNERLSMLERDIFNSTK